MSGADPASVVLRAHSANDGTLLGEGRLELIDNRVSADTGTVRIKGTVPNPNGDLWPDQSIVIKLQAGTLQDALVVPLRTLRQGAQGTFVWRISDGKAFPQPVQVEYADTEIAAVDGLEAGDQIVTDGYSRLTPGAVVKILQLEETSKKVVADRSTLR